MKFKYEKISKKQIGTIKSLWEKLNEIHYEDSPYFKEYYRNHTFEKRCEKINKNDDDNLLIEIVKSDGIPVGYCFSTVNDEEGEVSSLYIEESFRGFGIGKRFVENAIEWMKELNCKKIGVCVSYGHDSVLEFYNKSGFQLKTMYLELK